MEAGFMIRCLKCGEEQKLVPGRRPNFRNERISFGTDNYGADQMACECGNALEERSKHEDSDFEGEFIVEWHDISK
ncbi:hypothetical protein [Paenibacillus campi]|uniref:hypothetical protein n=1 Tax=Paenibacillus campi TaxID=3106031 RepID=UPI002AFE24ED|nr:hypothetical protein [Paenibacillus sp. SGZ-1009]